MSRLDIALRWVIIIAAGTTAVTSLLLGEWSDTVIYGAAAGYAHGSMTARREVEQLRARFGVSGR